MRLSSARQLWGSAKKLVERKRLMLPTETLFDTVLDVDRYHEFLPFCAGSRVTRYISQTSFEADLIIGFQSFNASYTSLVTFSRENWVIKAVSTNSAVFSHMDSQWVILITKRGIFYSSDITPLLGISSNFWRCGYGS